MRQQVVSLLVFVCLCTTGLQGVQSQRGSLFNDTDLSSPAPRMPDLTLLESAANCSFLLAVLHQWPPILVKIVPGASNDNGCVAFIQRLSFSRVLPLTAVSFAIFLSGRVDSLISRI